MRKAGASGWAWAAGVLLSCLQLAATGWAQAQTDGFYFGMPLAEANALLENTADYELAYRVDTATTADIFVRYRQHTLYLGHFLDGECCSVEKRAIVTREALDSMFSAYEAALGAPGKGADSRDGRSHYAQWSWKNRVLELSGSARSDGSYLLAHEEYDPQRMREAVLAQQRELRDSPQALDPLTGQPLPLGRQPEQQAAAANRSSPGDPVWEEAQPAQEKPPGGEPDPGGADDATGEDEQSAKEDKDPPDITGKNDWD